MKILSLLNQTLIEALSTLGYPDKEIKLSPSKNPEFGDISTSLPLILSKELKINPMEIGEKIGSILGPKPKVKKMKDPNRPKKAKTAFMFYCDAHRPALMKIQKKKMGKINIGNIAKELGKNWGKLTDKDKKPFASEAAASKLVQEKAMKVYQESLGL